MTTPHGIGLDVNRLCASYGAVDALVDVTFSVQPGEAVGIVGANGAGKSTLLRCISGLLQPRRGSIEVGSTAIAGLKAHQIARLGVAHVPEGRRVLQRLTVRENLMLAGSTKTMRREQMQRWLDTFPALKSKLDQPGGQLSGGQQQMLAIARGLMSNPKMILLDEPTLGLSPKLTDDLYDLLEKVRNESGATFVLVEQNIALAAELTTTSLVLQRGAVVRVAPSRQLIHDSALLDAYLA